jgi:hypothetical protein
MDLDKKTVLAIVRNILSPAQLKGSLIFWDKRIHEKGEGIRLGLGTTPMPFRGTMVFVDLAPKSNWAHPCQYVLIDSISHDTRVISASFPPAPDAADEQYIIILRYGKAPPHERYFSAFDENEP